MIKTTTDNCPDCGRPYAGTRRRCWKCHPGGKAAKTNGKPDLAGVFDGDGRSKPAGTDFLAPIAIHAADPPAPDDDGPAAVAIEREGRTITMTREQRRSLIEQAHAVRMANAARSPMPAEDLLAVFRPSAIPPEDYVPRVLDPPPPEEDEEPFECNLPAPAPTPRRKPGRPPKIGPEPVAPVRRRCGPEYLVVDSLPPPGGPLRESTGPPVSTASAPSPPAETLSDVPAAGCRVLAEDGRIGPAIMDAIANGPVPRAPIVLPDPAMTVTPSDPEIAAIAAVHATLSGLDPAARRRVLAYLQSRFPEP